MNVMKDSPYSFDPVLFMYQYLFFHRSLFVGGMTGVFCVSYSSEIVLNCLGAWEKHFLTSLASFKIAKISPTL